MQTFAADYPTLAAWLVTIGSALVATLVALVASRLALTAVARLAQGRVFATTVLQHAKASARVVIVLLALQLVWNAAPDDLPRLATIERFTAVALTVAIAWLGMRCVGGLAEAIILNNPVTMANNLDARRVQTQTRVFARTIMGLILFIGVAVALMSFPAIRSIGTSLLASAGVAGLVIGLAARPALGNLIAGLQIALTQPIRLDDVVIIEGEWGRIEEIGAAHVVVRIWDQRRLVVPLQWFIDHPFQNWTLTSSEIIGTVYVWTDYRLPVAPVAAERRRLCDESEAFDRRVCVRAGDAIARAGELDGFGPQLGPALPRPRGAHRVHPAALPRVPAADAGRHRRRRPRSGRHRSRADASRRHQRGPARAVGGNARDNAGNANTGIAVADNAVADNADTRHLTVT